MLVAAVLVASFGLVAEAQTFPAQTFPALTGRVVDGADLLSDAEEASLTQRLEGLETRSQRQLVVVTLRSLEGYAIEDYGYQLGRHWGIGARERNDGVLLIVAPNERKVRIEVGYGLEPILTDALSAVIINRDILPPFRDGRYAAGIIAGTDSLVKQLELPEDEARAVAEAAKAAKAARSEGGSDIPSLVFWMFFLGIFVLPTLMSFLGIGGRKHRGTRIWGPGLGGGGGRWGGGGGFGGGFGGGGGSFGGGGSSGSW